MRNTKNSEKMVKGTSRIYCWEISEERKGMKEKEKGGRGREGRGRERGRRRDRGRGRGKI